MSQFDHLTPPSRGGTELCIQGLLAAQVNRSPDATALMAPGRHPLTYRRLEQHICEVVRALNTFGVSRNDRVAIVLPQGPELASAILSVAAGATCAPLNPGYRENEFDFYLSDLNARALLVQSGMDSPARSVAQKRGIAIIEVTPLLDSEAGIFKLGGLQKRCKAPNGGFTHPEDVALVLHTSGTTSRPKIVPLTNANIFTSAHNIQATLGLDSGDRCLNIMPLFHIHGIVGALMSSLVSGGSVVCSPGFDASEFFVWLEDFRPTWYTAVPTMHHAILAQAAGHQKIISSCPLRLIRSSSSAMPPQLLAGLEAAFKAPVVESYGMTEAAHQICSNPAGRGKNKPGSVGLPAGPEVKVMDGRGTFLPAGEKGEIVIRGPNVLQEYENNPEANAAGFTHGWFRTGDEGFFDAENYLYITGRLKEMINRGGQKISPREVDEVLMDHPAIEQAVAFAVPHATLGEDVAAAIVLRSKAPHIEREIREFAAARLADFKVPHQIAIVDEIPKGPTGKVQRMGLSEKLSHLLKKAFIAPRNPVEETLANIWGEVLGREEVGIQDNFFELGGSSLLAARLFAQIETVFQKKLPLGVLVQAPTIEELAGILSRQDGKTPWSSLVPIQAAGSKPPLFCVHAHDGNVLFYRELARYLGRDQPLYAFQAQGMDGNQAPYTSFADMAAHYIKEMCALQPEGPYFLGGSCLGGMIAFEMAQQLQAQNKKVGLVALFNTNGPGYPKPLPRATLVRNSISRHFKELSQLPPEKMLTHTLSKVVTRAKIIGAGVKERVWRVGYKSYLMFGHSLPRILRDVPDVNKQAGRDYSLRVYPGKLTLFRPSSQPAGCYPDPQLGWGGLATGGLEVYEVPTESGPMMQSPALADQLKLCLERAQTAGTHCFGNDRSNETPACAEPQFPLNV